MLSTRRVRASARAGRSCVLDDPVDVARFWTCTTPADDGKDAWSEGMRKAPVVVVPLSCKREYLERYAAPDKGWTDMDETHWPAPYWDIDTGMAALLMLLTVTDEDLGACFFGIPPERSRPSARSSASPTTTCPSAPSRSGTGRRTVRRRRSSGAAVASMRSSIARGGDRAASIASGL